jgi:hypothetical protein
MIMPNVTDPLAERLNPFTEIPEYTRGEEMPLWQTKVLFVLRIMIIDLILHAY